MLRPKNVNASTPIALINTVIVPTVQKVRSLILRLANVIVHQKSAISIGQQANPNPIATSAHYRDHTPTMMVIVPNVLQKDPMKSETDVKSVSLMNTFGVANAINVKKDNTITTRHVMNALNKSHTSSMATAKNVRYCSSPTMMNATSVPKVSIGTKMSVINVQKDNLNIPLVVQIKFAINALNPLHTSTIKNVTNALRITLSNTMIIAAAVFLVLKIYPTSTTEPVTSARKMSTSSMVSAFGVNQNFTTMANVTNALKTSNMLMESVNHARKVCT